MAAIRKPYIKPIYSDVKQDDELDKLRPIVQAIGMASITSMPYIKMVKQILARQTFLAEISEYLRCPFKGDPLKRTQLSKERNFVNQCAFRLDYKHTLNNQSETVRVWNIYRATQSDLELRKKYAYPKAKSKALTQIGKEMHMSQAKSRAQYTSQRVRNAVRIADKNGWFIIFDTLTLKEQSVREFYNKPNAIRDYTRRIGKMVNLAEGVKLTEPTSERYQYFCAPEYGTENGRLHYHILHLCRTLPHRYTTKGKKVITLSPSLDPNIGLSQPYKRDIEALKYLWPYGISKPMSVRYKGDAYARAGWKHPVDPADRKKRIELKHADGVAIYVTKYITKTADVQASKLQDDKNFDSTVKRIAGITPPHAWRMRMSRNFGYYVPSMDRLSVSSLIELTRLHWTTCEYTKLVARQAKALLRDKLQYVSVASIQELTPVAFNLLQHIHDIFDASVPFNLAEFERSITYKLKWESLSYETKSYLTNSRLKPEHFHRKR